MQKEQEFSLQQSILENQRRQEEREHEMKMLQIMMGYGPGTHIEASPPNIHVTGDLHLPVNANVSSRSLYEAIPVATSMIYQIIQLHILSCNIGIMKTVNWLLSCLVCKDSKINVFVTVVKITSPLSKIR